ncbi:MAG: BrnT family toxin [Coriobacteriia bacterium]|nr:BrnT family toxin [Coriobacteriia bacterium]
MVYFLYKNKPIFKFEFDPAKSQTNKVKHGIDFVEAQELWKDEDLIESDAYSKTEKRFAALGKIRDKHYVAFFTNRKGYTRIISVRRARNKEVVLYEQKKANSRGT